MKILWIDDNSIENHPIAKLLLEELRSLQIEIDLLTADISNSKKSFEIFDGDRAIKEYLSRRKKRKNWLNQNSNKILFRHKKMYKAWVIIVFFLNSADKKMVKYFVIRLSRKYAFLRGYFKSVPYFNNWNILIFSRAYLIPLVILKKAINRGKNSTVIYYSFELYGNQHGHKFSWIIKRIELYFLRHFEIELVTQNKLRAEYYRDLGFRRPINVVGNYKSTNHRKVYTKDVSRTEVRKILWIGSVGGGRNLEKIIKWLENGNEKRSLSVFGYISKSWRSINAEIIARASRNGKLFIGEEVPEIDLPDLVGNFDVGLIMYDKSCLNHLYCAPAKLTDYLHEGLPVVASNLPGMKDFADRFEFIQLFDETSKKSFDLAMEKIEKFLNDEGREFIMSFAKELDWGFEFNKIRNLFVNLKN